VPILTIAAVLVLSMVAGVAAARGLLHLLIPRPRPAEELRETVSGD